MSVVVDPELAFSYSTLVEALEAYLNRTDYTVRIPLFIQLVEAKLNRLLDDPEMEQRATLTGVAQYTLLPTDVKRIIGVTTGGVPLKQISGAGMTALNQAVTGTPRQYAIIDGSITFAPASSSNQISILYARRIPPLTGSAPNNWVLNTAPDIYLYGALMQAHVYGWQDERVPGFKALYDEAIEELRVDADNRRWAGAPLAPRIGRT